MFIKVEEEEGEEREGRLCSGLKKKKKPLTKFIFSIMGSFKGFHSPPLKAPEQDFWLIQDSI